MDLALSREVYQKGQRNHAIQIFYESIQCNHFDLFTGESHFAHASSKRSNEVRGLVYISTGRLVRVDVDLRRIKSQASI